MELTLTIPQILAFLFLAVIAAFLGELVVGNAPFLGFLGALGAALLGVVLFVKLPLPEVTLEPRLEDIPVVRAILGGALIAALFAFIRKKRGI